jgi:hypothetical protein
LCRDTPTPGRQRSQLRRSRVRPDRSTGGPPRPVADGQIHERPPRPKLCLRGASILRQPPRPPMEGREDAREDGASMQSEGHGATLMSAAKAQPRGSDACREGSAGRELRSSALSFLHRRNDKAHPLDEAITPDNLNAITRFSATFGLSMSVSVRIFICLSHNS